jgi:hypothetical protein
MALSVSHLIRERESVNRSQMDIKCKIYDIRNRKKKHLFLDISSTNIDTLVPSLYQCVETRNMEVCWLLSQPFPHLRFNSSSSAKRSSRCHVNRLTRQTVPTVNRKHFFLNILCIKSFCPQKRTHNRTVLFHSSLLKYGRHSDYWNQRINMRMRVWYLDTHEAVLCCDLVLHIGNLLRPLQLFYFRSCPIYWLFLVPSNVTIVGK